MALLRRPLGRIAIILCWAGAILFNLGTLSGFNRIFRELLRAISTGENVAYVIGELIGVAIGVLCAWELYDHYKGHRRSELPKKDPSAEPVNLENKTPVAQERTENSAHAGNMYCVLCGTENPQFARFCRRCGEAMYTGETSEGPTPFSPRVSVPAGAVGTVVLTAKSHDTSSDRESLETDCSIETSESQAAQSSSIVCELSQVEPSEISGAEPPTPDTATKTVVIEYASWEGRLIAYILDLGVIYFIIFGLYFASGLLGVLGKGFLSKDASEINLIFWIVLPTYMVASLMLTHTTVGKYALGLEVAADSEEKNLYPSFWRALLRETFGRVVSSFFFGMGYWRIGRSTEHQAWSDQLADTVVRHRPTNRPLKRALLAFTVIALILDIAATAYGNYKEDREQRHKWWETQVSSASSNVQSARQAVDEIIGRPTSDLAQWQSDMAVLKPALSTYDERIDELENTLKYGERVNLIESDTEKHQVQALLEVLEIRKKEIAKQRQEADLIIAFAPSSARMSDLQSDLRLLDSDIDGLNQQATQKMVEAGLK